jgi:hypothetical protein
VPATVSGVFKSGLSAHRGIELFQVEAIAGERFRIGDAERKLVAKGDRPRTVFHKQAPQSHRNHRVNGHR